MVILSSQAYSELWPVFFLSWNKYYSNIKITKYVISSEQNYYNKELDFHVISGDKMTTKSPWSLRIKTALKKVKHRNLFFSTEDMIFSQKGSLDYICKFFKFYDENTLQYLRSSPIPPVLNYIDKDIFVREPNWALHNISLQPALINKKFFIKNLFKNDNSRSFEEKISYYNRNNKKVYSSRLKIFPYKEIVIGGNIIRNSDLFFQKVNLKLPSKIKKMSYLKHLKFRILKEFKFWLLYKLPINFIKYLICNNIVGYKKKFILKNNETSR